MTSPAAVDAIEDQERIVLTAHPLQRVGAYAFTAIAGCSEPGQVTAKLFDDVVRRMADDAVRAALLPSTTAEGAFWLKASGSFFPNSKMNHPSRARRSRQENIDLVLAWRTIPNQNCWPGRGCVLCGRDAVGYFAKVDVPLAESEQTRNSTPRGHAGLALCWPCVCCFHALPYGCRLTGGQSSAVHSWDDRFLGKVTTRQVQTNHRHITLGNPVDKGGGYAAEVEALERLCGYEDDVYEGIELLVFTNYNVPSPSPLQIYALEQPLAEWLGRVKGGGTCQRDTVFATGTLVAVVPQQRMTKDFGTMSRGFNAGENPVIHEHELYSAELAGDVLLDLPRIGTFETDGSGLRIALTADAAKEAASAGAKQISFRGFSALRLSLVERRRRAAVLLRTLTAVQGGAKRSLHYGDCTPALMLLGAVRGGVNPFTRILAVRDGRTSFASRILREEISVWRGELDGPVYLGWSPGFLGTQRETALEELAEEIAARAILLDHPRVLFGRLADEIENGAHDGWFEDPKA